MSQDKTYEYDDSCVAVVGMALRVPGAKNIDEFWNNLMTGRVCRERISQQELASNLPTDVWQGDNYIPYRYSIKDYELFDASHFGMSAREASLTDPQHRLVLEYAVRAFENAGYVARDHGDIRTGVFACADVSHYLMGNLYPHFCNGSIDIIETFVGTGNDFLATRVAYKCDFKGPAMTIQTACSSSLTSLHMAVLSLLGGECDRAVVASATVLLPDMGYSYAPGGIHSPDGLCRPFDHKAMGTAFSNGVAAVVLKSLNEAIADGDHIWAVIRGTASANDGSEKMGFVAPGAKGQARAIRSALSVAGARPEHIAYVEGHGTGTQMGDPIEVEALLSVFGPAKDKRTDSIVLGSVKGNLGHLNATAGLCGFTKTCLCLYHGIAPGTANFDSLNPAFGNIQPLTVSAENIVLQRCSDLPLLAGVSSFGFGGTNVHAVLQEPPHQKNPDSGPGSDPNLLLLSAPHEEGVLRMRTDLANHLDTVNVPLADAAFTLAVGRKSHDWRSAIVAKDLKQASEELTNAESRPRKSVTQNGAVAFLFPGQGNLHKRAGVDAYTSDKFFRGKFDTMAEIIRSHGGPDILALVRGQVDDITLASTAFAQPLLFGLETAFAQTLMARGVRPECLLGHSLGEYAAAVLAGVFSPEDGARLVVRRAALMQDAPPGKMMMVTLHRGVLQETLGNLFNTVELSVVNGPANCVLTGSDAALDACKKVVEDHGQRAVFLNTSHAFHSAAMDGVLEPFRKILEEMTLRPPELAVVSNVTGQWGGEEMATPEYWVRHIRQTVEFDRCLATVASRVSLGIEVGPGFVMRSLGTRADLGLVVCPGLDSPDALYGREEDVSNNFRDTNQVVGELWEHGADVDWEIFHSGGEGRRIPLPGTVLNPRRYWIDPPESVGGGTQALDEKSFSAFVVENEGACSADYVAAENDIEERLVAIWEELLLIRPVGVTEEFMALGGNSVQVMQMLRLAEDKGLHFSVKDVFETKNIRALAKRISTGDNAANSGSMPLHMPISFSRYVGNGPPRFAMLFDSIEDPLTADLGLLAQGLARRHEALRLRWDASGFTLFTPDGTAWGEEYVLEGGAWRNGFSGWKIGGLCLASLPQDCPECSGELPWYIAMIPGNSLGKQRLLAVFSKAVCDSFGAHLLHRDIEHFILSGEFPEEPSSAWLPVLEELPEFMAGQTTKSFSLSAVSEQSMAYGPDVRNGCYTLRKEGFCAMIDKACRMVRMPRSEFVACAFAKAVAERQKKATSLRIWCDIREHRSGFHQGALCSGHLTYPLDISQDKPFSDSVEAIHLFKEQLLRAHDFTTWTHEIEPSFEFMWLGPHREGLPSSPLIFDSGFNEEGAPLAIHAFMDEDCLVVQGLDSPLSSRQIVDGLVEELEYMTHAVFEREDASRFVPADFSLCDLGDEELARILAEVGKGVSHSR